jgi:L-histidine Nalpha-methyltransferase
MVKHLNFAELLEFSVNDSDLGWTLCFIGDNQQTKLAELVRELKNDFSDKGDGKKISSGFSYWGVDPSIKWAETCSDRFYPVMRQSIQSFRARWRQIYSNNLQVRKFHYVSLGVGTGEKDYQILASLLPHQPNLLYFPVDMSSTMLRMAIQEVTKLEQLKRSHILPIQIDFSDEKRIENLRNLVEHLVPDEPVLFSLLGNTLANFQFDVKLLKILSKLMRPDDLLLLEVAATKDLADQTAQEAAKEYANIESFKRFVTSALLQNTDLSIGFNNLLFQASIEESKAILIKIIYQNSTKETIRVMLPDWSSMGFNTNDTIRLYLTRKYSPTGIEQIIMGNNLSILGRETTGFGEGYNTKFGMDLVLVSSRFSGSESDRNNDAYLPTQTGSNTLSNTEEKAPVTIRHINTGGGAYIESNTGTYVQGDYITMSQNLTHAAAQIQELIEQLQKQDVTVDVAQKQVAKDMATQAQTNSIVKDKLLKWGQSLGDATVSDVVKSTVKLAIRSAGIPLP